MIPDDLDLTVFWSRVQKGDGCWLWTGALSPNGYGRIGRRAHYAHRISYEIANGRDIPKGLDICHTCDVRRCVKPTHLFLGSRTVNVRDMWSKGRGVPGRAYGELAGAAKLTREDVLAIRSADLSRRGAKTALARRYGIGLQALRCVLTGRTWGPEAMKGT